MDTHDWELNDYNVLFVTLDSCTYESACHAQTPHLNRLSAMKAAETHATYTLPAHIAFFNGHLPHPLDGSCYYQDYQCVWYSAAGQVGNRKVMIPFDAPNVVAHYFARRYNVVGLGGVRFFNGADRRNLLPTLFPQFIFYGPTSYIPAEHDIPRNPQWFPLSHVAEILDTLGRKEPFFVFMNCPETHMPYDSPGYAPTAAYVVAVKKLFLEMRNKPRHTPDSLPLTASETALLKAAQVQALEWCDRQLGYLFAHLPTGRPTLVVACGDHGEEFGEGGRYGHAHVHETVLTVPLWVGVVGG